MSFPSVSAAQFPSKVLESPTPVLVKFWAPWCGPCRAMAPVVESVVAELAGRLVAVEVNVDEEPSIAASFQVRGVPALLLFKGGQVVEVLVGAQPCSALKARLQAHL